MYEDGREGGRKERKKRKEEQSQIQKALAMRWMKTPWQRARGFSDFTHVATPSAPLTQVPSSEADWPHFGSLGTHAPQPLPSRLWDRGGWWARSLLHSYLFPSAGAFRAGSWHSSHTRAFPLSKYSSRPPHMLFTCSQCT